MLFMIMFSFLGMMDLQVREGTNLDKHSLDLQFHRLFAVQEVIRILRLTWIDLFGAQRQ